MIGQAKSVGRCFQIMCVCLSVCSRCQAVPQKSFCCFAGRRNVPGGGDSQVDELIWGSDVDGSADPRIMEAKAQLFQGAAGTLPIRTEGRELWCCKIKGEYKRFELTKSL